MNQKLKTQKIIPAIFIFCIVQFSCIGQESMETIVSLKGKEVSSKELTRKIDSIMDRNEIPGLSIAIINANKLVYYKTFGVKNMETLIPVDDKTMFEAASLSKPMFAYFVMKLVDQGILDLDKPLFEYLEHPYISSNSRENYKLITARMVLSHRSGFPNHANGNEIELAFRPGTDFLYSGEAFQYLAMVIAELKGINIENEFNSLFCEEVTKPLNMKHSTFVWNNYLAIHKANGHDKKNQPTVSVPGNGNWNGKNFSSYSSLHSEASEYARFLIGLLEKKGLKKESFTEMFSEHTVFREHNPLKQQIGQTGWGLGMAQKTTSNGTMHMHTGNNHDFQSYMMVLPENEFGLVFFTNSGKAIPFIQGLNTIIGPVF